MDKSFPKRTIEFWQPHYEKKLTEEDGKEIVRNLSGFFDVLAEWDRKERESKSKSREVPKKAHELVKAK